MEEKKKSNGGLIVLIIILLLICIGMGAFIFVNKDKLFVKATKDAKTEEKATKEVNTTEVTDEVKKKIERFIDIATTPDVGYGTYNYFIEGANGLTDKTKYRMTNTAIYQKDKKYTRNITLTDEEINGLTGTKPDKNEPIDIVMVSDFNEIYKELFNEEPQYEISDLKESGCPTPWAINKEKTKLVYFHRCGGTYGSDFERNNKSIDTDENYYYVHQELSETPYGTNDTKKTNLLWKFDKDLNFVSTEKE